MFKILEKEQLSPMVHRCVLEAPKIARAARPGQFIILRIHGKGERIPLTIADFDAERGTITIIWQEVGKTTEELAKLKAGDMLSDVVGPLGQHFEVQKYGTVVCVGGGVGVPPLYPKTRALKGMGNYIITILGARTASLLLLEKEMAAYSDEFYVTTDDGSKGLKGFVSDQLRITLEENKRKNDLVVAIGPVAMMKAVSEVTKQYGVRTLVSLNSLMLDGTGMCGGCRVRVDGETKFACVDGPIFDGHLVDWEIMAARQTRFVAQEKEALELFRAREHAHCKGDCQ